MSSSEALIQHLTDLLECPVCLECVEDPRLLPCQHTFCFKCLEGIIRQDRRIRCPCCNKETSLPNGVSCLQIDFRSNNWLEIIADYKNAKATNETLSQTSPVVAEAPTPEDIRPSCCSLCKGSLPDPVTLSCKHMLCQNCFGLLLVGGTKLHCPSCSCETTIDGKQQMQTLGTSGQDQHVNNGNHQVLPTMSDVTTTTAVYDWPELPAPEEPIYHTIGPSVEHPRIHPGRASFAQVLTTKSDMATNTATDQATEPPAEAENLYHTIRPSGENPHELTIQEPPGVGLRPPSCPICDQVLTDPVKLRCGHVLCESCTSFLLPVGGTKLHCPTCSCETTIGESEPREYVETAEQDAGRIGEIINGLIQREMLRNVAANPGPRQLSPSAPSLRLAPQQFIFPNTNPGLVTVPNAFPSTERPSNIAPPIPPNLFIASERPSNIGSPIPPNLFTASERPSTIGPPKRLRSFASSERSSNIRPLSARNPFATPEGPSTIELPRTPKTTTSTGRSTYQVELTQNNPFTSSVRSENIYTMGPSATTNSFTSSSRVITIGPTTATTVTSRERSKRTTKIAPPTTNPFTTKIAPPTTNPFICSEQGTMLRPAIAPKPLTHPARCSNLGQEGFLFPAERTTTHSPAIPYTEIDDNQLISLAIPEPSPSSSRHAYDNMQKEHSTSRGGPQHWQRK